MPKSSGVRGGTEALPAFTRMKFFLVIDHANESRGLSFSNSILASLNFLLASLLPKPYDIYLLQAEMFE